MIQEGFTPAQHDTHWNHTAASHQALCDTLAAEGAASALPRHLPFSDLFHDTALFLRHDALILDLPQTLDTLYRHLHPPPAAALPLLSGGDTLPAGRAWEHVVLSNSLNPGAMRLAATLRAAPLFPVKPGAPFHCTLCSAPCPGWGSHLLSDCPLLPPALLYAFRRLSLIAGQLYPVTHWLSASSFYTAAPSSAPPTRWSLLPDGDLTPLRLQPHATYVTWSGLIHPAPDQHLPGELHADLSAVFLNSLDQWLSAPPPVRHTLSRTTTPSTWPAPAALLDLATTLRLLLLLPAPALHGPCSDCTSDRNGT